jgi:hypothetical protein
VSSCCSRRSSSTRTGSSVAEIPLRWAAYAKQRAAASA